MGYPLVSVIVVNWNGVSYIEECLASVLAQDYSNIELIVVDNGSVDNSLEVIKNKFSGKILLIENKNNTGFALGNNLGIGQAKGEYVALLNNDTVAKTDWISQLIKVINRDENIRVGMCASKVLNYFKPEAIDTVGHLIYWDGLNRGRGRLELDRGQYNKMEEVFFPSGAAALYRKSMLNEIGLLDEDFFAYGEDADIGVRAQLAGWRCLYAPEAVVYHRYSGSSSSYSALKVFFVERNRIWVLFKNFPLSVILLSPFYTFLRYFWHSYGAVTKKGAAGKFASENSGFSLLWILIKANFSAILGLPGIYRKRIKIRKIIKVSQADIFSWFKKYKITAREIALKD